jgi:hypothetical protein
VDPLQGKKMLNRGRLGRIHRELEDRGRNHFLPLFVIWLKQESGQVPWLLIPLD